MAAPAEGTLDGIVLLDKPLGLSSHSATSRVRRITGAARAGHVGALDPLASGMLPICLGEATKLAGQVQTHAKAYRFTLQLGVRTATCDLEGEPVERLPVPPLTRVAVEAQLARFLGEQDQVPPMYSAIKQAGQPLYRLARQGRTVERAPRRIRIDRLTLLELAADCLTLEVHCGSGTYVRVLGEDLARALGSCGHLAALRREWVAPFEGRRTWSLEELEPLAAAGRGEWLLPPSSGVATLPRLVLTDQEVTRLLHGQTIGRAEAVAGRCWLVDPRGFGIGLGQVSALAAGFNIRPDRMFTRPLA